MKGIRSNVKLPEPECLYGYTSRQIDEIFSEKNFPHASGQMREMFDKWMYGQTMSICEGKLYNHEKKEYEPAPEPCGSNPHGVITYVHDVKTFFAGNFPLD